MNVQFNIFSEFGFEEAKEIVPRLVRTQPEADCFSCGKTWRGVHLCASTKVAHVWSNNVVKRMHISRCGARAATIAELGRLPG